MLWVLIRIASPSLGIWRRGDSTHNICFYGELMKIILQLSPDTLLNYLFFWIGHKIISTAVFSLLLIHVGQLSVTEESTHMSHRMTKPTKWHVRPAKTQISLGICPVLIRVFAVRLMGS